jgi:small-conductance mechanosensitive channel
MGREFGAAIASVVFAAIAFLLLQVIYRVLYFLLHKLQNWVQKWRPRFEGLLEWWQRLHAPLFAVLALFAGARIGLLIVYRLNPGGAVDTIYKVLDLGLIVAGTWGLLVTILAIVDFVLQLAGKPQVKRLVRAQITAIMNLLPVISAVIIFVGSLVIVDAWQPVSQVILGAAVLGAVIAAVTNSSTLGNIFASTIATTGGILAVGDAVDLGPNEAGEVKEITLTHAKIQINTRRHIWVPMNQFVTQRFHHLVRTNKHTETNVTTYGLDQPPQDRQMAWVYWTMDLDWGVDLVDLRRSLLAAYTNHGIRVQVVGLAGTSLQVRIWLLADPSDLGSRQHIVREFINRYLARRQPEALPGARLEHHIGQIATELQGLGAQVQGLAAAVMALPAPPVVVPAQGQNNPQQQQPVAVVQGQNNPQPVAVAQGQNNPQPVAVAQGQNNPQPVAVAQGQNNPQQNPDDDEDD